MKHESGIYVDSKKKKTLSFRTFRSLYSVQHKNRWRPTSTAKRCDLLRLFFEDVNLGEKFCVCIVAAKVVQAQYHYGVNFENYVKGQRIDEHTDYSPYNSFPLLSIPIVKENQLLKDIKATPIRRCLSIAVIAILVIIGTENSLIPTWAKRLILALPFYVRAITILRPGERSSQMDIQKP